MVHVDSEIGRLRRALVHEPGREVDGMVPAMMEELLFDDILYGEGARDEHARFRRVLQMFGVEVLDASDLLTEVLGMDEARAWTLEVLLEDLPRHRREELRLLPAAELSSVLVGGIRRESGRGIEIEDLYVLPPLPNWCFQRDPQVLFGDGVILSSMAAPARHRESLLARAVFRFHPDFRDVPVLFDPLDAHRRHPFFVASQRPSLEGGDVLVLSPDVIAVGLSERTNRAGIKHLATALASRAGGPRWMVVVEIPRRRAYMHLDTLITQVDRDACLVYPPVVLPGGPETARVHELDLTEEDPEPIPRDDLLSALRLHGIDLEPIPCGGIDSVNQQREQWTDGANALAVAPGVVTLYDRNVATAEELARRGFDVVSAEDLLLGRREFDVDSCGRLCVLVSSHEMSRARGGPHCLSHPLWRDPVEP